MASVRYSSERRYLMQVLRAVARRIRGIAVSLDESALGWRLHSNDPTAVELLAYLRDAEREDLRTVVSVLTTDGVRVVERQAAPGFPVVPTVEGQPIGDAAGLLWDFVMLRDEMVWQLETAGDAWSHAGDYAYRGSILLADIVREIGERDLDVMWHLQRIAAQGAGAGGDLLERSRVHQVGDNSYTIPSVLLGGS